MARRSPRRARPRIVIPDGHGGRRLSNGAFVLSLLLLLGLGLGGVLVLSTRIQEQQTQLEKLQDQAEQASYHEAALQGEVQKLSATNSLARMAAVLGMVPNTNPLIIQMPGGASYGTPDPMDGTEMPGVAVAPAESSSASPTAGGAAGPSSASSSSAPGTAPSAQAGG
ncbi:hypothetical protein [uncultured Propionibacterium sp.]|uniref:hypothetical protein n=1 Tax=uncultured Propionibacterium sp. TaxID=218066 RepID=UPI002930EBBB|nr:hypothetical protein [uncultured Propionibacterium sp.]